MPHPTPVAPAHRTRRTRAPHSRTRAPVHRTEPSAPSAPSAPTHLVQLVPLVPEVDRSRALGAEPCGTREVSPRSGRRTSRRSQRHRVEVESHIAGLRASQRGAAVGCSKLASAPAPSRHVAAGGGVCNRCRPDAGRDRADARARDARRADRARQCLPTPSRCPSPTNRSTSSIRYGVLHHTPDTPRAIAEVHRVLRTNARRA